MRAEPFRLAWVMGLAAAVVFIGMLGNALARAGTHGITFGLLNEMIGYMALAVVAIAIVAVGGRRADELEHPEPKALPYNIGALRQQNQQRIAWLQRIEDGGCDGLPLGHELVHVYETGTLGPVASFCQHCGYDSRKGYIPYPRHVALQDEGGLWHVLVPESREIILRTADETLALALIETVEGRGPALEDD